MESETALFTDQQLKQLEGWEKAHLQAMNCLDFEETVREALGFAESLWERERSLWDMLHRDPSLDLSDQFKYGKGLLERMLPILAKLIALAPSFTGQGYGIHDLLRLQQAFDEIRFAVMPDDQFFSGGWLEPLAQDAVDEYLRDETKEMDSFGD